MNLDPPVPPPAPPPATAPAPVPDAPAPARGADLPVGHGPAARPAPPPRLPPGGLSIVIPAHNEAETIAETLVTLKTVLINAGLEAEIILVDDGSTDGTSERARGLDGVRVLRHPENLGYGAALKTGLRAARGELVATLDADGQHDPRELLPMLDLLGESVAMVVGHRQGLVQSTLLRAPGKWLLGATARYLSRQRIPDLNCGLRLFRAAVVRRFLHLCPNGFSISTTLTLALLHEGFPIVYHPIQVRERGGGRSRVSPATGLEALLLIFRLVMLFSPLRVFVPVSLFALALGLGATVWSSLVSRHLDFTDSAVLFFVVAVLVFLFGLVADSIARLRREMRANE